MFHQAISAGIEGIDGYIVQVEADVTKGVPQLNIVGLPDVAIRESKDRIRSAIINSDLHYPNKRIVINLSPSDIKKSGSHYDLPIAISILDSEFKYDEEKLERMALIGELSLNGKLQKVEGVVSFILAVCNRPDLKAIIIPAENAQEAQVVSDVDIYIANDLVEVSDYLRGKCVLEQVKKTTEKETTKEAIQPNFEDVKGNLVAKRAAEISAAGYHNFLMIGAPGSGKSMIAKRMSGIMSSMDNEEYLEVSKIYSSVGKFNDEILRRLRPFRAPHHTSTTKSIIGGGNQALPGEVVLAHKGILFLDEMLEFQKRTLETLRQPIEDKYVQISRIKHSYQYPSDFLFLAATNPCPCGNHLNPSKDCTCNPYQINQYLHRASKPLLDRFDIFVEMLPIQFDEFKDTVQESSEKIRTRVLRAQEIQLNRYREKNYKFNSAIAVRDIETFCPLDDASEEFMKAAFDKFQLSLRSYHKVLCVARTIADLQESDRIELQHLSEAISFRRVLAKYWGS